MIDNHATAVASFTQLSSQFQIKTDKNGASDKNGSGSIEIPPNFTIGSVPPALGAGDPRSSGMKIGLIDSHLLSQDCLRNALESMVLGFTVYPFASVADCVAEQTRLDVVLYFWHVNDASSTAVMSSISAACAALADVPLVVLSDAEEAQHPKTVRLTLKSGARGFIPARTTDLQIAVAAIRFVRAGGTFAPLDLLLSPRPDRVSAAQDLTRKHRLTSRQMAVLSQLEQGKANKIIAHELGMSESTVKVHVRNIMRKIGATNRTQAVYKAQKLWDIAEFATMAEL